MTNNGIFRNQDIAYQNSILPNGVTKIGLTAGLEVNLEGLVRNEGFVMGLNHFGYSAPAGVLDEKFGFTAENVFNKTKEYLK